MKLDLDRLREDLLRFYDRRRRDLPWRGEEDPYRILVSEVMLQQTRVETVKEYYGPWLERFPNLEALAAADEADVLKAWEGLGYYRRARNLRAAAVAVREREGGTLPPTRAALRQLPGVGEYTAGAVASIAFGEAVPAVDGNVRRVLARLFDVAAPLAAWLRDTAGGLVDPDRPGDWNQALMELGATVCVPRGPRCGACPVSWACRAREAGTVDARPAPAARRAPRAAVIALAVLRRPTGEVLMVKRSAGGLLGGMWALPEREVAATRRDAAGRDADAGPEEAGIQKEAVSHETAEAARLLAWDLVGSAASSCSSLAPVRHRFTHIDATYVPWLIDVAAGPPDVAQPRARWTTEAERTRLAVPVAQRRVLDRLAASSGDGA